MSKKATTYERPEFRITIYGWPTVRISECNRCGGPVIRPKCGRFAGMIVCAALCFEQDGIR